MLFHESRREARVDAGGDLVTLADQDRTRWDHAMIDEAVAVLDTAYDHARPGPYQLQAAIAGCHAIAEDAKSTDWQRIADLYALVARVSPSPVVELNRAVAVAEVTGPAAGLELVDALRDSSLAGYHLLPATRADLLRRLNRLPEAKAAYEEALALAPTEAERRFLTRRIDGLGA
jgi:RNA polymerase sigma-70 factor (ECF subfamily)